MRVGKRMRGFLAFFTPTSISLTPSLLPPHLLLRVSPRGSALRTRERIAVEVEEMTWVMEEDTQASVREN